MDYNTARIKEYFESLGIVVIQGDLLQQLIDSHKRQREIVSEYAGAYNLLHRRWRFLPFVVRLWIGGHR